MDKLERVISSNRGWIIEVEAPFNLNERLQWERRLKALMFKNLIKLNIKKHHKVNGITKNIGQCHNMFIKIDEKWALASDEHCWIIKKFEQPSQAFPEGRWKGKAYLQTFENAVQSLARRKIRLSKASTMTQAVKDAQIVRKELKALLDPIVRKR